jgi:transcriptional regulator with XRE-family HTH domain
MPPTPFGDQLKREREMRGVSLEEISAATRISTRFLEALEKEQWDRLPGGVFRRGFIRSVARYLGLDGDDLISEYELQTKDAPKDLSSEEHLYNIPRDYRPAAIAIVVLLALLAGGWFVYAHFGLAIAARLHKQQPAPAVVPNSPAPGSSSSNLPSSNSTVPSDPARAAEQPPAVPLDLKIQAGKACEFKVSADGRQVFDGHIDADEVKSFEAHDTLEINAADPSALFLSLNGETLPPFGLPGQPGSIMLTHKDLKPQSGGGH